MKIAIAGASGLVGREVVSLCAKAGHHTIQIDRASPESSPPGGGPKSSETEHRTADIANSYSETLDAMRSADAVIHLAAIPNPVDKDNSLVHSNNVNSAFNGFHAAAELGIKNYCYVSSVNAIGLAYANRPLTFDHFPMLETHTRRPTDAYALAKAETELQAFSFADWFPHMKIAVLRIHQVSPRAAVRDEHAAEWDVKGVKQLWGWVSPAATARACLLGVDESKKFPDGSNCEVFNIAAPTTTQEDPGLAGHAGMSSRQLAQKYFPNAQIREGWGEGNEGFWDTEKAERILGWSHEERE
ncbi:hypothetical protein AAFC00_005786 [Neodothiora populina]|uniref:NAD-dependent epimerase/dehydratase domain-containing protein n=1 Tax=Neodothiora populina TaxID=2781224 RepID=A0ABR3P5U3_9PEZI